MLIPYIRRSRGDEEKISLDDQRAAIGEWAARADVPLAPEVVERGVSGHSAWTDRELGDVIDRCKRGEAAGVIVAYFSRLTREEDDQTWQVLTALKPHRLVCVRENIDKAPGKRVDLATAITAYQSTAEWETLRGNLTRGKHATWERGGYVGSPPAGYALVDGVLGKTTHAEAIGQALHARAGGASWSEVARILSAAEVPTSRGTTTWSTQACRALARNPLYRGTHRCTCGCGEERFRAELAVVAPSTWEKAQPKPGPPGRKDPGQYLLSGLLFCGGCGRRLIHYTVGGGRYEGYRCSAGDRCQARATVSADKIEPWLVEEALDYYALTEPSVGHDVDPGRLAELEHERDTAEARLAAFVSAADPLDPGYADRLPELRAAVHVAEAALLEESQARARYVSADEIRTAYAAASDDEKRQLLRLVLDGATVTRGKSTQDLAERVTVHAKALVFAGRADAA